ncbi:MAG: hypothetical protein FGF53_00500 [Candidatus Brockarchaeota archaeon]|nr:hypothetical protein [Candidatus Brockarchaeota archaeon]MBO3808626.1 hypothetical protein [Candidatus Brockarchaeota archaeon]
MRQTRFFLVMGLGALAFLMPVLKLKPYVAFSIQLLVYTLMLSQREDDGAENLSETVDLTLVGRLADNPENLNLESSVFKTLSDLDFETDYRDLFEKAVRRSVNGHPLEKTLISHSGELGQTGRLLIRLASSLFAKDAVSAKKILKSYVILLRENEALKNERKTLFSEARFRARIMLTVSASLMGFLSAATPVLNAFSAFSATPILQSDSSLLLSLILYVLSISILVHRSLAFRNLAKTILYSALSFAASFLVFNSMISGLVQVNG